MRWVRPILVMPENASDLTCSALRRCRMAGSSRWVISSTAATCMAVGNVSFDDWDMLTSSLGWTGSLEPSTPPAISMARLAITSLAFMLVCVPLPVCHTLSGKCSWSLPSETSRAAAAINPDFSGGSLPRSAFTWAAASFMIPMALITGSGIRSSPMEKCSRDRAVWAPQYRSAGTSTGPMLSVSVRVSLVMVSSFRSGSRSESPMARPATLA